MVINQGDLFWVNLDKIRPVVVVQNETFNRRLSTVIVCALTSNLGRARAPGNVRLPRGAGGLSEDSVANVTQIFAIDKGELTNPIGRLGRTYVAGILSGINLVLSPVRHSSAPR